MRVHVLEIRSVSFLDSSLLAGADFSQGKSVKGGTLRCSQLALLWLRVPSRSHASLQSYIIAIVLVTGSAGLAQVSGGTISGSVRDSSERGIAGAHVSIRNAETAILRSVTTDNDGIYTAPNLVAGTYQVSASKE